MPQAQSAQFQSVALPPRLPLILQPENRDETSLKDAKLVNGYVELSEQTGEHWIFKRPGLDQTGATKTGTGFGVYNWLGDVYRIQGATMYKNDTALSGTLDTTNGVYRFSSCLGATPKMQFGNGVAAYNYDASNGIVAISGTNWPSAQRKGWVYLNGTTYILDADAKIHGCAVINTPSDWSDVLNVLTAQIEPDGGRALTKQLVYAVAMKEWTTEIFYDAGNTSASPLASVQGAKINYGIANQDSLQELDGILFWVCTNRSASPQVLMLENLKPNIVSTKPVERLLGGADLSSMLSFAVKHDGHKFYGITLKADNITLVYDAVDKRWAQWTDSAGNYFPIVSTTYSSTLGKILQHETNGKLYLMDSEYFTDDDAVITVDLITPNFDAGVRRRKHMNAMKFIGDQTDGSILQVRTNDWDYNATRWTNFRKVDLSVREPMLIGWGSFYRRAHHIRHQCDTRMRLQAIEMQYDIGTL